MNIDERIKYEYENMLQAIMPSERIRHANRLAELEKEKAEMEGSSIRNPSESGTSISMYRLPSFREVEGE